MVCTGDRGNQLLRDLAAVDWYQDTLRDRARLDKLIKSAVPAQVVGTAQVVDTDRVAAGSRARLDMVLPNTELHGEQARHTDREAGRRGKAAHKGLAVAGSRAAPASGRRR